MFTFWLFILSGAIIMALTVAKRREEKKKKSVFFLKLISRGDERMRHLRHETLHFYSQGKDKFAFWSKKQLPLKLKSILNRLQTYLEEKGVEHFGDVRNSRHLKKPDNISEFFKNMSDIEKGNGELHDGYQSDEETVEVTETKVETIIATTSEMELVQTVPEIKEAAPEISPRPKIKRTPRKRASAPRRRKVQVVEILD